jgi:hypothetical protein
MAHIGMGRNLLLEIIIEEVMNICKQLKKKDQMPQKKFQMKLSV